MAVAITLLVVTTWRLWLPTDDLAIAMVNGTGWIAPFAPWLMLGSLGWAILTGSSAAAASVAISLALAVLCDQHRLQPWVYQGFLYCTLLAISRHRAIGPIRWIAISIYVYSALGKFDFQFIHTVGQDFVGVVADWIGLQLATRPVPVRLAAAMLFPATELLVALLLILPATRRLGGAAAVGLHIGLIAMLSPIGLNHSAGVLAWNVCLIVQSWWLFTRPAAFKSTSNPGHDELPISKFRFGMVWTVALIALVMPLFERSGHWDHWTSWALYSPHSSRVSVQVHPAAKDRLPPELLQQLSGGSDRWLDLSLSGWSVANRLVPVLPQARYQLALAGKIGRQHDLGGGIRVIIRGPADRLTGRRQEQRLAGLDEVTAAIEQFWLVETIR